MSDLTLVLVLLAFVALLASLGRRAAIADPIVFAMGGLALALVPGVPHVALPASLVLVVFLPPLIYAAAQDTSWAEVRRNLRSILRLAVGLVLVTMVAVACVAKWLVPELPWAAAFTLGAIVSPPDAVAAKAIASTLRLPRRLVAILEGEGLFNDATALVAFQVAVAVTVSGELFAPIPAVAQFIYAAIVALVIGLVVGWLGRQVLMRVGDPAAASTVTLLLPFAAYLPADDMGASGVLAVLTLALYLSRFDTLFDLSGSRLQGNVLWEMIDFLLTGLSFVLVGLQLPAVVQGMVGDGHGAGQITALVLGVCTTVIVVRPLWIFGSVWLAGRLGQAEARLRNTTVNPEGQYSKRYLVVLSWAGMRGVVSLAVALSLPATFPSRDLIVFVTFIVILATLIGQGLSLPALIRRINIGGAADRKLTDDVLGELEKARIAVAQAQHSVDTIRTRIDQ